MAHEEYNKIIDFFSLPPEEKSQNLEEVFKNTVEFFDRFQYILMNGTPEEKKEMIQEVLELQKKLKLETEHMCQITGLSEEELKQFSQDSTNFSDEEWEVIQNAKAQIEEKASEISGHVKFNENEPKAASKGSSKKKKKWVKT